jgi:hypothetical protein
VARALTLNGATTADQPAGTVVTDGPSSAVNCAISTFPATTPAGRGMLTVVTAAVLTDVDDAPAVTVPVPPVGGAVTVIVRVAVEPAPPALDAVSVTVCVPAANVCDGDCTVDVPPSPKFHAHDVGDCVEVSANDTVNGAVPDSGDAVNDDTGTDGPGGGCSPPAAGRSARNQPAEITPVLKVQVAFPVGPAVGRACRAVSDTWAAVPSQLSVQAAGGVTVAAAEFIPTPPTSIVPVLVVVTPGTVRPAEFAPRFDAVEAAVSNGVAVSTPANAVIPAFHFTAVDSPQA